MLLGVLLVEELGVLLEELGVLLPEELGMLPVDEELDGALVAPELELPLMPDEVLPEAPLEPEPDLLKCASHSERDTCPSLFLSTSEKLGVAAEAPEDDELPPAAEGRELEPEDELPEAPVVADGDDDGLVAEGLDDEDEEDCATASEDRAKRTAAVMMLRRFGMEASRGFGEKKLRCLPVQTLCR